MSDWNEFGEVPRPIGEMTEAEKNLEIAKLVYPGAEILGEAICGYLDEEGVMGIHIIEPEEASDVVNFFVDWNDLMPLVIEYDIWLTQAGSTESKWYATKWWLMGDATRRIRCDNDNPKAALADCLLLVLREINNDCINDPVQIYIESEGSDGG